MTDKELLQQALDALEKHVYEYETIQAIKARLAAPLYTLEQVKDVAQKLADCALMSSPPEKKWVGLTDEEKFELVNEWNIGDAMIVNLCALIEAKLKEKNT